jgi:hypothetical protein
MQIDFKSRSKVKLKLKMENFIGLAFVNHLHKGCRKDSYKQSAVHPIVLLPQRSKQILAQMNFVDYLLYDAYSNHVIVSESFSITSGYIKNSQYLHKPLGC